MFSPLFREDDGSAAQAGDLARLRDSGGGEGGRAHAHLPHQPQGSQVNPIVVKSKGCGSASLLCGFGSIFPFSMRIQTRSRS